LPIGLAVRFEFREVVIERGVDHTITSGCSAADTFNIVERTAMNVSARGFKRRYGSVRAGKPKNFVTRIEQFFHNRRPNKSGRAGNEDTHRKSSKHCAGGYIGLGVIVVK
jgi:hypothetical protein